jgi:hypothetical protein
MKVTLPRNNLGCLGIRLSKHLYFDFYIEPYFGMFISTRNNKYWISFRTGHIKKERR